MKLENQLIKDLEELSIKLKNGYPISPKDIEKILEKINKMKKTTKK